jgi:hypothetical protein
MERLYPPYMRDFTNIKRFSLPPFLREFVHAPQKSKEDPQYVNAQNHSPKNEFINLSQIGEFSDLVTAGTDSITEEELCFLYYFTPKTSECTDEENLNIKNILQITRHSWKKELRRTLYSLLQKTELSPENLGLCHYFNSLPTQKKRKNEKSCT